MEVSMESPAPLLEGILSLQRWARAEHSGKSCSFTGKKGAYWCAGGMQELPLQYQGMGTALLGAQEVQNCEMLRLPVKRHWNLQCGACSKRNSHLLLTVTTHPGVTCQGDYFQLLELHEDMEIVFRQSRLTPEIAFSLAKQLSSGYLASKRVAGPNTSLM